jgi:RES domain-containing protein
VLATAEVPDDLGRERIEAGNLPGNWRDAVAPSELSRFGDDFVRRDEHCLLLVPSALAPTENNWLLNPQHHSFRRIVARELEPLHYDPRMFRKPGRR